MTTINQITNVKDESNLRTVINQVVRQVSDTTGSLSVSANGNVVLQNTRIFSGSFISLSPRNASARDAKWFISTITSGQATFTFSSVASGPALFDFAVIGVL